MYTCAVYIHSSHMYSCLFLTQFSPQHVQTIVQRVNKHSVGSNMLPKELWWATAHEIIMVVTALLQWEMQSNKCHVAGMPIIKKKKSTLVRYKIFHHMSSFRPFGSISVYITVSVYMYSHIYAYVCVPIPHFKMLMFILSHQNSTRHVSVFSTSWVWTKLIKKPKPFAVTQNCTIFKKTFYAHDL